jgi:hypothetical protein
MQVKLAQEAKPEVELQCQAQKRVCVRVRVRVRVRAQAQTRAQVHWPQGRVRHRVGWLAGLGGALSSLQGL